MLQILKRAARAARRQTENFVYSRTEYRVYRIDLSNFTAMPTTDIEFSRNNMADLEKFQPTERWQNRSAFLNQWQSRLRAGSTVYTRSDDTTLLHFGWLTPRIRRSLFTEVGQAFCYPHGSAGLWDFYTHPPARGRGLYQANLVTILGDIAKSKNCRFAYIGVLADNLASRHAIEKLHFEYRGSLIRRQILGSACGWSSFPAADLEME